MALFPELVNEYLNSRPIPCRRLQAQLDFVWIRFLFDDTITTGGHRTRVAAVTLDNMAERVFAQREDLP